MLGSVRSGSVWFISTDFRQVTFFYRINHHSTKFMILGYINFRIKLDLNKEEIIAFSVMILRVKPPKPHLMTAPKYNPPYNLLGHQKLNQKRINIFATI